MVQWVKFVFYYLWIAPHALLMVVTGILYARRLYRNFPIFFIYTIYEIIEFALLFSLYLVGHSLASSYRYLFSVTLLGSTALRFGIIHEVFNNIFCEYSRLQTIATTSMRWVTGALVTVAGFSVLYLSGPSRDVMAGVKILERSADIIQVGLLLFLFLFSHLFGLSWRSYIFGIAIGFAVSSSSAIANWTIGLIPLTEQSKYLLDLLPMGSFHIAVLVWIGYLLAAEKSVGLTTYTASEIDHWSGELERSR